MPTGHGAAPKYFMQGDTVTDDDLAVVLMATGQVADYSDVWRWNSQSVPPISNGQVRSDSGDWSSAVTTLWITGRTDAGLDASSTLASVVAGSTIVLAQKTDSTRYMQVLTTADGVDNGNYFTFAVSFQDSGGQVPNSSTQITVSIYAPVSPPDGSGTTLLPPRVQRMLDLGAIQ